MEIETIKVDQNLIPALSASDILFSALTCNSARARPALANRTS